MSLMQRICFTPVDNERLANLCGPLDDNLRHIALAFEVTIARRSEVFKVTGEKAAQAICALEAFYLRAQFAPLETEAVQLGLAEFGRMTSAQAQASLATHAAVPTLLTRRGDLRGRTPRQHTYIAEIQRHDITFGVGPAGTGKTYLAVACAVDAMERDAVQRIILVRPAVEAGEKLGFLPVDLAQKVDPYLRPLYDALYDLMGFDRVAKLFEKNLIEIAPLAYMRGRTLNNAFIILDEAQNTTPEQMKMFLTRIGFGAKAVITGDVTQIDLARHQRSGLVEAEKILAKVAGVCFHHFQNDDVVRHPLVQKIVDAYDVWEAHASPKQDAPHETR